MCDFQIRKRFSGCTLPRFVVFQCKVIALYSFCSLFTYACADLFLPDAPDIPEEEKQRAAAYVVEMDELSKSVVAALDNQARIWVRCCFCSNHSTLMFLDAKGIFSALPE